ncbi:hypothetical protein Avbf_08370 [Armadillidium vulgare]|nr:hypothetical protein Avbf_08370 [Armadillidium vulgare]
MEHKANTHIPISLNDVKFQNVPQNAALLLAKLQQKVARLEITLRDKETEIAKLNSSCKASYVNELKIQTEVYYQEVFRLKNQLNKLQAEPVQCSPSHVTERHNLRKKTLETNSNKEEDEDHPPLHNVDKSLLESIEKLRDENERLTNQLTAIQEDKAKLAAQYESLVNKLRSRDEPSFIIREHPQELRLPRSPKNEISDESLNILKVQIEELQNKEKVWEDERSTYKELVLNLKEDRIFFKDTSQQRNDELWALQKELIKLQKEIGGLQLNGKPICKQCTKPSYRTTKLTRKIVVKDMGTVTTPRPSSKGSGSTSVTSSSSDNKNSSKTNAAAVPSGSPKRLPTPIKSLKKETPSRSSSSNTVSKSVSSSTPPSSGSDSAHPSPSHKEKTISRSSVKGSKKDGSSSSPSKHSSPIKTKSPASPCSTPLKRSSSTHSNSPSGSRKGTPPTGCNMSPNKKGSSSHSPSDSPLRGKPEEIHQDKKHQNSRSHSTDSSTNTSPRSKLVKKLEKIKETEDDEIIAIEILKDLNSGHLEDSPTCTNEERRNSNSLLSSSKPSQSVEEDTDVRVPSIDDPSLTQNDLEDNQNTDQEPAEEPYYEKVSEKSLKALFCLLEGHENRRKKMQELKTNLTKSGSSKTDSPKSVANTRKKHPLTKSKSSSAESRHLSSPSTGRSPTNTVAKGSHVKGSPQKLKRIESKSEREFKNPPGEEGENMKDIDRMIGLLEGHIARKAFLALYSQNSGKEDPQEVT